MQNVTIVGAGMAGLTAALRLAERGYKVTLFERDSFVGGKFRATEWKGEGRSAFHEHSYHMFLNWYHNFWQVAKDVGALADFAPMDKVRFMRQGEFPKMKEIKNFGAPSAILDNLRSGVLSPADMYLYMYSIVDLLSTSIGSESSYHDLISVNAFASTKLYATEASVSMYDEYLTKTFAIASYESSVKTFQTFLQYGACCPEPLYWALKGDCYNHFLSKVLSRLHQLGVDVEFNHNVKSLIFDKHGTASELNVVKYEEFSPSLSEMSIRTLERADKDRNRHKVTRFKHVLDGPLIIAVPPSALSELLEPDFLNRDPDLGDSAKLRSLPMASLHLHLGENFSKRLESMKIKLPPEPVVLLDSKYKLSFVANSSLWPNPKDAYFNIVASDSRPLNTFKGPAIFMADREWYNKKPEAEGGARHSDLSIDRPKTTIDYILHEFRRYVHFEVDEIEIDLLHLDRNAGRELFINDVGSWKWRPETRTKVPNVFLAGDFCKHFIDVVSLEGAVVSGLQAADCVCRYVGAGAPIQIKRPKTYPPKAFWPLKVAMTPYAVAAKLWSMLDEWKAQANS